VDFIRTGLVALAQIPLVVALGVKGNLLGLCVGMGYEKMKAFHKIVGRVIFLAATLHVALYRECRRRRISSPGFSSPGSGEVRR
jgi:ferric-chelate reductase